MSKNWIAYPVIVAAVAALAGIGLAKDTAVESQWTASPVKVERLDQDWQDATFLSDPDSKAEYALKNDGRNLYVLFLFKEAASASTIDYTGMKVFFSAEGKKSKDLGIHFLKKQASPDELIASLEKKGETPTEERKAEIRKQKVYYLFEADVINAKKLATPADPAVRTDPPVYWSGRQQRTLIWELRIPLSRTNQPGGIGAEPGQTIKLGFEWGGLTSQVMKNMMADMSTGAGAVRQDAGLSGSLAETKEGMGSLRGGGDFQRDPRTRLHSFWLDVKLAVK